MLAILFWRSEWEVFMKSRSSLLLACGFFHFLLTAPVIAQSPGRAYLPPLQKEDLTLMRAEVAGLSEKPVESCGSWQNEETGNSGTVKLLKTQEIYGRPCQLIEHVFYFKCECYTRPYTLTLCEIEEGNWKIYSGS